MKTKKKEVMTMPKQDNLYDPDSVECVRWSPGSCGRKTTGANLILALACLASGFFQDLHAEESISVKPSGVVQFTAGSGQVFELQGSDDLKTWHDTGDVVFGEGERVSDFIPTEGGSYRFFRVKISPSQAFGFAPKSLQGRQVVLNDDGDSVVFSFPDRSVATLDGTQFAYSYRKLGDTVACLELVSGGAIRERIDFDFSADFIGMYERTKFSNGEVTDIERGPFSLRNDSPQAPDPPVTTIPESLVGLSFLFSDGDNHERLDFVTTDGGRAIDGSEVDHFSYEFSTDDQFPQVTVHYLREVDVVYELEFGADGCGTCVRRESVDGVHDQTSEGIFTSAASVYHSEGADTTTVTLPADELTGRTYVMQDGGTPCRLTFETQRSGKCVEGQQIDDFEFDYIVSCTATSRVTLRFGTSDSDIYYLNHSDQTFRRHEVRNGAEQDIDTGTFSESP